MIFSKIKSDRNFWNDAEFILKNVIGFYFYKLFRKR